MSEEVKIYPNEIVIGNKSFFGLDKNLINLVENLTIDKLNAELKRDKYKEVLDKIKEIFKDYGVKEDIVTYSMYQITGEEVYTILELLEKIE